MDKVRFELKNGISVVEHKERQRTSYLVLENGDLVEWFYSMRTAVLYAEYYAERKNRGVRYEC